jgi:hypothetical protein
VKGRSTRSAGDFLSLSDPECEWERQFSTPLIAR